MRSLLRAWPLWGLVALACKLAFAVFTLGSNDIATFHRFAAEIADHNVLWVYQHDSEFNHPPLIGRLLGLVIHIARSTGLPFAFCFKLPAIVADMLMLPLLLATVKPSREMLSLVAIAPASILLSGFHGNTDPLMLLFLVAAIYFLEIRRSPALSGIALGLAISVKIVPLLFAPAFLLYIQGNRRRLQFLVLVAATAGLLALPEIVQAFPDMVRNVFLYSSRSGMWGFTRLARAVERFTGREGAVDTVASIGRLATPVILLIATWWMHRRRVSLFASCAVLMFLFVWLLPGFGVHYLEWLVPFAIIFGELTAAAVYGATGFFMAIVYNYWAKSFPWYYANSIQVGGWPIRYIPFELACWLLIGGVLAVYLVRLNADSGRSRSGTPLTGTRGVL